LAQVIWGHGISEADQQAMVEGGNLRYIWLGAVHMITGYDHLLFLFGVIFYLNGFKDILRFVTLFTLGHSLTLIFATYAQITANYYLVDAVIALSVCYKAFDNLNGFPKYLKFNSPNPLAMILIFGLIHGFGLSTRLQQLPLPDEGLIFRILSFNVGVELGQVAALSILVVLLTGWRLMPSFRKIGGYVNILLLLAGIGLFAYQIRSYFHERSHHHEESHETHSHEEDGHHPEGGDHDHSSEHHHHDDVDEHEHHEHHPEHEHAETQLDSNPLHPIIQNPSHGEAIQKWTNTPNPPEAKSEESSPGGPSHDHGQDNHDHDDPGHHHEDAHAH
jgi:hypothetical protein